MVFNDSYGVVRDVLDQTEMVWGQVGTHSCWSFAFLHHSFFVRVSGAACDVKPALPCPFSASPFSEVLSCAALNRLWFQLTVNDSYGVGMRHFMAGPSMVWGLQSQTNTLVLFSRLIAHSVALSSCE